MYQIAQWLIEHAEAERGSELVESAVLDMRIEALNELPNWRGKSDNQFKETLTVAHFASYFSNALSRKFYKDYEYQTGAWANYTYADEAPDFRNVDRFRMSEPGTLHKRREKGEAKAGYIAANKRSYGVDEFSEQFDVSWRTILNDDLGEIKDTPNRMAKAALRFEDGFVSDLYDNATSQAALIALGANYAGTGRLNIPSLTVGVNAMKQRVDGNGDPINVRQVHLVIPSILEVAATTLLADLLAYGGEDSNVLNRFIAGVHVDPYMATASPNIPWYLFAAPSEIPAVTVARLSGAPGPFTYMKQSDIAMLSGSAPSAFLMGSAATGDIEFFVEDIIGGWDDETYAGVTDYQGIYYSSGTTP